jgi:hypothetical protein
MREEVGAVAVGLFEGALATPAADGDVVSGLEDGGDFVAAEVGGAGVVGVVEQAAGAVGAGRDVAGDVLRALVVSTEGFEAVGVGIAEDAGEQADDGVDDDGGGEFSAGEDVVADGEFAVAEERVDALVDAFVASTEEDDAAGLGEFGGDGLGEGRALGGEQDDGFLLWIAGGFGAQVEGFEASEDGFGLEDHAFAAAEGTVVDSAMTVVGEGAEVVGDDLDEALLAGAAEDAVVERTGEEVGEDGYDVEKQLLAPSL